MSAAVNTPPSQARRQALRDADQSNVLLVIDTYPIDKYYAVMHRLVKEFDDAADARQFDQAYIYGIRFASFSLESLPKHKDYKRTFSRKKAAQVEQVLAKLESVTQRMDAEELQKQKLEEQAKREAEEAKQREDHVKREKEEAKRRVKQEKLRKAEEAKKQKKQARQSNTKQSALAKLQALQQKSDMQVTPKNEIDGPPVRAASEKREDEDSSRQARQEDEKRKKKSEQQELLEQQNRAALEKERIRLGAQAQRLADQQRESEANEEWETMKFLFKEAAEGERLEAEAAAAAATKKEQERRRTVKEQQQKKNDAAAAAVATAASLSPAKKKETMSLPRKIPAMASSSPIVQPQYQEPASAKTRDAAPLPDLQPTVCILPEQQPSPYKPKGMRPEEVHTIEILRTTITKQEHRLQDLEEKKIPALIAIAKMKLKSGERKGAIFCMARKKKVEATIGGLKNAIFTMETQILMLETAVENRQVQRAMKAAADAMESLQSGIDIDVISDVNRVVNEMSEGLVEDIYMDEDELLRELMEDGATEGMSKSSSTNALDALENDSILSLPNAPAEELPKAETPQKAKKKSFLAGWL